MIKYLQHAKRRLALSLNILRSYTTVKDFIQAWAISALSSLSNKVLLNCLSTKSGEGYHVNINLLLEQYLHSGALYYYFKNKDNILIKVVSYGTQDPCINKIVKCLTLKFTKVIYVHKDIDFDSIEEKSLFEKKHIYIAAIMDMYYRKETHPEVTILCGGGELVIQSKVEPTLKNEQFAPCLTPERFEEEHIIGESN